MIFNPSIAAGIPSILVALVASTGFGEVRAHDAMGAATQELNSASRAIWAEREATPFGEVRTHSVLNNLRLWPVPWKLTFCFIGGSPTIRMQVVEDLIASWPVAQLTGGRLSFDPASESALVDCGPNPSADIKISFQTGAGHWSYVGVESLKYSPSMNFDRLETLAREDALRLVAHEFGHALGLEHEHQSPNVPDCHWNFEYIYRHYQWKSEEQMKSNFEIFQNYLQQSRSAYISSAYDKMSVMHYSLEPAAFEDGDKSPCYIDPNYSPSDLDLMAIRLAYGIAAVQGRQPARGAFVQLNAAHDAADEARLRDLLNVPAVNEPVDSD